MDDVEKLKKIAKLSQEMRKHGFATHSDDAVQAAQAIYKGTIANEPTPEQRHQALQEKKNMAGQSTPEFEAFSKQVSQRLGDIEGNLSTVISKMNEIIKEINDLQKAGSRQGVPREKDVQAALPKQEPAQAPKEPHARSGNYTPQDVQIDKIFYFGNKKST